MCMYLSKSRASHHSGACVYVPASSDGTRVNSVKEKSREFSACTTARRASQRDFTSANCRCLFYYEEKRIQATKPQDVTLISLLPSAKPARRWWFSVFLYIKPVSVATKRISWIKEEFQKNSFPHVCTLWGIVKQDLLCRSNFTPYYKRKILERELSISYYIKEKER